MAYTTINKGSLYMNPVIYTGSASSLAVTGVNFQPDMVWLKDRDNVFNHQLYDSVRTPTADSALVPNQNFAENDYNAFTSLDSDGFTLPGNVTGVNTNGTNYVSWNWKAGGTASSNTDGSITSSVSANTTSGFSVVGWTGTGANATVGHGLGVVPKIIIVKNRNVVTNWIVGGSLIEDVGGSTNNYLLLNETAGMDSATTLYASYNTDTIGVKTDANVNGSGNGMVAYCFADVKGFSKFGSYVGNGSTDGTFVYTGFKPAWLMVKRSSTSGTDWYMFDNKRNTFNVTNNYLDANTNDTEASNISFDFTSNGFKLRDSQTIVNGSGSTFIYMAFAENPLVSNTSGGIPTTAR